MKKNPQAWPEAIYRILKDAGVRQVGYVPDAGHKRLIELCLADREMRAVVLTTEAEVARMEEELARLRGEPQQPPPAEKAAPKS